MAENIKKSDGVFNLFSDSFANNAHIPLKYLYEKFDSRAENQSPNLKWGNAPEGTKSFAIVCNDPDAVGGDFIHWLIYNLPTHATELAAGILKDPVIAESEFVVKLDSLVPGPAYPQMALSWRSEAIEKAVAFQGKNDFGQIGYDGPCPPAGTGVHHYIFTIYALDDFVDLEPGVKFAELENSMKGHILDEAKLVGLVEAPAKL